MKGSRLPSLPALFRLPFVAHLACIVCAKAKARRRSREKLTPTRKLSGSSPLSSRPRRSYLRLRRQNFASRANNPASLASYAPLSERLEQTIFPANVFKTNRAGRNACRPQGTKVRLPWRPPKNRTKLAFGRL